MNELEEYIRNQKSKLETLGIDIDIVYKQKPRLTKEKKQYKKYSEELEDKFKKMKEVLSSPEEVDSDTFKIYKKPSPDDILRCANKFYQKNKISIPRNHDYTNFKTEKKKTFNYKYNDEPQELSQLLYSIFNQQKYRYKINISFAFTLIKEERPGGLFSPSSVIEFKFYEASTNTRLFDHPQTINNKHDIDNLVQNILKQNLIEK